METVATILYGLDILLLLSFQLLNRDYGQFAHAVSDYGVGKTARLFKVYVISGSTAAPLLAWQFWAAGPPGYPATISIYLVLVMLGRLAIGLFPNDLRGTPRTRAGRLHRAATLLAFTCAFMTVTEATPLLATNVHDTASTVLVVLKHLISAGFIAVIITISAHMRRFFGLAERMFLYATALWCLVASLTLPPL